MSKELSVEEANEICAEYMGYFVCKKQIVTGVKLGRIHGGIIGNLYSDSLDALVPIWEKLNCSFMIYIGATGGFKIETPFFTTYDYDLGNLEEKACIATAKAIKDIYEKI